MRVKAIVAYDGSDYRGFQRQAAGRTVQEVLESALEEISRMPVRVLAAGRTDAGVHAEGQVIAFDVSWRHGVPDLERALNAILPQDAAVRELTETAPDFHPRFDAASRRYKYTVYNARVRSPLARRTSLYVKDSLSLDAMEAAAVQVIGVHDFAAFGRPTQGDVTVRRVLEAGWVAEFPWLFFEIEANAFLFRMVRSIVGTLLQVGKGRLSPERFGAILRSRERNSAGQTAPAHGLCLVEVQYG
jgi:tRNA pseudouridine38-40 synthase